MTIVSLQALHVGQQQGVFDITTESGSVYRVTLERSGGCSVTGPHGVERGFLEGAKRGEPLVVSQRRHPGRSTRVLTTSAIQRIVRVS